MMSKRTVEPKDEHRAVARIDKATKDRLDDVAGKLGITTSDVIRIGLNVFLPQIEAGKLDMRKLMKN